MGKELEIRVQVVKLALQGGKLVFHRDSYQEEDGWVDG